MSLDNPSLGASQEIIFKLFLPSPNPQKTPMLFAGERIIIQLPRFITGNALTDDLLVAPSQYFTGTWYEGYFNHVSPYNTSYLALTVKEDFPLLDMEIIIFRENGIKVYCGFEQNWEMFRVVIPSLSMNLPLSQSTPMGEQCKPQNYCSGKGTCDHCWQKCQCWNVLEHPGFNAPDLKLDCSSAICPFGKGIRVVPGLNPAFAHSVQVECSANGICDRSTGTCKCALGWEGENCQRRKCSNQCSGHGVCLSMQELARRSDALPLSNVSVEYATFDTKDSTAWDHDVMYGCLCDSSWAVGLGAGETQKPEWFGPDCRLRHCPTGDDPMTDADETDCSGVVAEGGRGVGQTGNICHVDCSNRGICDYKSGQCKCFDGFYGNNCGTIRPFSSG